MIRPTPAGARANGLRNSHGGRSFRSPVHQPTESQRRLKQTLEGRSIKVNWPRNRGEALPLLTEGNPPHLVFTEAPLPDGDWADVVKLALAALMLVNLMVMSRLSHYWRLVFLFEEAFMQLLAEGQFVRHAKYGLGVVTQSGAERTSIDFHLHGPKKFATQLMTVELTDEAPPSKPQSLRRRRGVIPAPPVTMAAMEK